MGIWYDYQTLPAGLGNPRGFGLCQIGKRWPWHILLRGPTLSLGENTHGDTLADGMLYSVVGGRSWVLEQLWEGLGLCCRG